MPLNKSDCKKTEKIHGMIYNMSPGGFNHATVNLNIHQTVSRQLKDSLCLVYLENLNLLFEDDTCLVPDILVLCDRKQITPKGYGGVPRFIAETLSPSTARRDRGEKKELYRLKGVEEYWIVDPRSKSIEIYYLQDGQYVLQDSLMLEEDKEDEAYNAEMVISLRAFPHVTMRLGELFENTL